MHILVSGSHGLIGSHLVRCLQQDDHLVSRLVRPGSSERDPDPASRKIRWDTKRNVIDAEAMEGLDAVIHLAGESLFSLRWTKEKKQRIRASRVEGTSLLAQALANLKHPPRVLLSASAIGYYGQRGEETLTENSPPGSGFLAEVCQQWEAATRPASDAGIRTVLMRFGIVLSKKGGALGSALPIFRAGLGGQLGSGQQCMSWISLPDLLRAITFALAHGELAGPVNFTSPQPVTNARYTQVLGRVLRRPTVLTVPAFAARLMAGELADEMLFSSVRAMPARLTEAGFDFQHPDLESALHALLA